MMFGVFSEPELDHLRKARKTFPAATIGRGGQFQPWKNGKMSGVGSRMPSGGRKGDTYAVYPGMEIGDQITKIKKIFKCAKVSKLVTVVVFIC
jgi:hypothetical protein